MTDEHDTGASEPWWRQPAARWIIPVAVVAVVLVFAVLRSPQTQRGNAAFRGELVGPVAVAPVGDVDTPPTRFVWRRDSGASYYRFELFGAASSPVFTAVTVDTFAVVDSTVTVPHSGHWVVTPLDDLRIHNGPAITTPYQVVK